MILDTDVLIWYLRGNINAEKLINSSIPFKISVVNYMELIQGMNDKNEFMILQKYFKKWAVEIIQIHESISTRAMFFMEDFYLSHSMELADALIAATVLDRHETLLTANIKHYSFVPNLKIKQFKPN